MGAERNKREVILQIENSRWKGNVEDAREESERIGKIGRLVELEG